ncbi:sensor histidine kinase [Cutibacterium acnes JCM 18916]|nr:sensor histidine kinase [Cutibacterium acnes JCM 18916]
MRHAQAHTCCVEIDDEILVISDNGRGRGGAPEGNGLTGMRRRVEAAGESCGSGRGSVATVPGLS